MLKLLYLFFDIDFTLFPVSIKCLACRIKEVFEVTRIAGDKVLIRVIPDQQLNIPHSKVGLREIQGLPKASTILGVLNDKMEEPARMKSLSQLLG